MLNKDQKTTILSYISQFKPDVSKHLRDIGLLNNNNTISQHDNHESITDWFLEAIAADNYEIIFGDVCLEISGFHSRSGNPVLFDFPASEFDLT